MNEIRIPYKPNRIIFILAMVFFGACTAVIANVALTNDRGLILNRVIEFSQQGATVFYWVLAGISASFVLIGILALIRSFTSNREIVISDTSLTAPKSGISKAIVTVNFSDITDIGLQTIQRTTILNIHHSGGKLSIPNSMLPNKQAFEDLVLQLQRKIRS